jgi:putative zinc finger protein
MRSIQHLLGHWLSCKEATRVVSQMQERSLTWLERWKLRMHLAVCAKCTRFEQQLRLLREALRRYRT